MLRKAIFALLMAALAACGPPRQLAAAPSQQDSAEGGLCLDKGGAIERKGVGKTAEEAEDAANRTISRDINSMARSVSKSAYLKVETEDDFEEYDSLYRVSEVETYIPNLHAVKNSKLPGRENPYQENGEFVSVRHICHSDAAKPYLDSLGIFLRNRLKVFMQQGVDKESCESAREIYAKTLGWQRIVEHLGQTDKDLQKEYEDFNARIEKDCARRGIYLEVRGARAEAISNKLKETLSKNNCLIERNPELASLAFRVEAEDCEQRGDGGVYNVCSSCVKMEITGERNKKDGFSSSAKAGAREVGRVKACEKAAEEVAPEIWDKVKDRIREACE